MGSKFKKILESKHRNHTKSQMGLSTAYVVVHDICTDKTLTPDDKMLLIDRFCQDIITVQDIAEELKAQISI